MRSWWVEFDDAQMRADGEGPFRSAQVPERFLELAPPIADPPDGDASEIWDPPAQGSSRAW